MVGHMIVLGGGRMIGPPLIHGAVEQGWRVTVFNRQSPPPADVAADVRHETGDRRDAEAIEALVRLEADVVVDLSSYRPDHVELSLDLLGKAVGRYLLMSTAAVYEPQPILPWDEATPLGSHPFWGDYGANKLANERLAVDRADRMPITSLRAPYLVGEPDFMGRLQFIADRIAHDPFIFVSGSGNAPVHLASPRDVAGALLHLADHEGLDRAGLHAFNIGNRQIATLRGLVMAAAEAMGRQAPTIVPVELQKVGLSDVPFSWQDMVFPFADQPVLLDDSKLRATGFLPSMDLTALLSDFVERYHANGGPAAPQWFPAEERARTTYQRVSGV